MIILTEKPSVAKDIAAGLGGFIWSKENARYERNSDCIVSAHGHLLELFMPDDYDANLKAWKMETLPIIPEKFRYKPIADPTGALKKIKLAFAEFGQKDFILATDAEREGELIGAMILEHIGFNEYSQAKRFWVSEALTPEVVRKGIENAKSLSVYTSYKKAGYARQQADWLIGINISRVIGIQTGIKGSSFGRVQTAVLGAIYDRDMSIRNFVSTPYNQLKVMCAKDNYNFSMMLEKDGHLRFEKGDEYVKKAIQFLNCPTSLKVTEVKTEKKTESQPKLFNITGLQKHCATRFKMTPARTLEVAQELYEKFKCLSYPRTPSVVLGDDNVELFLQKYGLLKDVYTEESAGCNASYITPDNKRLFDSSRLADHHALIPLDVLPDGATQEQKAVYMAVLERFFCTIKEPHIYLSTTVKCEKDYLTFSATGKSIVQYGWKNKASKDEDDADEQTLPQLSEGETVDVMNVELLEKFTKPKKHYTNATLLSLMENPKDSSDDEVKGKLAGLGTPATRAAIIETIIKRGYVAEEKQNLVITDKGIFLIEAVRKIPSLAKLISIATTTQWEEELSDDPDKFIEEIKAFLRAETPSMVIEDRYKNAGGNGNSPVCPVCRKGQVREGARNWYCSGYKDGCNFTVWKEISGAKINASDVSRLVDGKKTALKKMRSKAGKDFTCRLFLDGGKVSFCFEDKKSPSVGN